MTVFFPLMWVRVTQSHRNWCHSKAWVRWVCWRAIKIQLSPPHRKVGLSLEWRNEGVVDDESGDDNRNELTSEREVYSRHDCRRGWRNESGKSVTIYFTVKSLLCAVDHLNTSSNLLFARSIYSRPYRRWLLTVDGITVVHVSGVRFHCYYATARRERGISVAFLRPSVSQTAHRVHSE